MVTRTDVAIDFNESPRLAEVAAPSDEYNAQDVVDTTRVTEATFQGLSHSKLLDSSGKQDIGDGVFVGITNAFQNMQVAFESRLTPTAQGTITTAAVNGMTLIDSTATFVATGVSRGAVVINFTDQSITEVLSVDSETELTTRVLRAGFGNTYGIADTYNSPLTKLALDTSGLV